MCEILLPCSLYKLHTTKPPESQDAVLLGGGGANSVYQPYYDMPQQPLIDEWVLVLDSLLQDVHSVHGCE